jgi:hypothetical protein
MIILNDRLALTNKVSRSRDCNWGIITDHNGEPFDGWNSDKHMKLIEEGRKLARDLGYLNHDSLSFTPLGKAMLAITQ